MVFAKLFDEASKQRDETDQSANEGTLSTSRKHQVEASNKKRQRRRRRPPKRKPSDAAMQVGQSISVRRVIGEKSQKRQHASPSAGTRKRQKHSSRISKPSREALELSRMLKELSSRKRLEEALNLYWDGSNDDLRDGHHGCIVVDCCARCGAIEQGEKIVEEMKSSGVHVNVETKTALLKGYAHSGMCKKAADLFTQMCLSKETRDLPNVRTLNTLLRGCLWTATSICAHEKHGSVCLAGGIVTSQKVWSLYHQTCKQNPIRLDMSLTDSSSYEYFVAQLCYALRVEEASEIIDEMMRKYKIKLPKTRLENSDEKVDASATESLAFCTLALARARALRGEGTEALKTAREILDIADMAESLRRSDEHRSLGMDRAESTAFHASSGGKRAWRQEANSDIHRSRRDISNALYRSHRLSEIRSEAEQILRFEPSRLANVNPRSVAQHLLTRLLYLSGGGTTTLESSSAVSREPETNIAKSPKDLQSQIMTSQWHSFGLSEACRALGLSLTPGLRVLQERDCLSICDAVGGTDLEIVSTDGCINFQSVFNFRMYAPGESSAASVKRPLDIELGSGHGDWIIRQAMRNPSRDYVAVELRSDRIAQTFCKVMLNPSGTPLSNVCCVGSDCSSFLRHRVGVPVSTIFVNHPEPPTQTYGSDENALRAIARGGAEPAHMLASDTLLASLKCLDMESGGRLVIVTDNRWYARLICVTLHRVLASDQDLDCCAKPNLIGFRRVETFGSGRPADVVNLYEGHPNEVIGHCVEQQTSRGASYFDRLWRTGAGIHAERKSRFIIVVDRGQKFGKMQSQISAQTDEKGVCGQKKKRKRSEEKQRRRNERRLAKRETTTCSG